MDAPISPSGPPDYNNLLQHLTLFLPIIYMYDKKQKNFSKVLDFTPKMVYYKDKLRDNKKI